MAPRSPVVVVVGRAVDRGGCRTAAGRPASIEHRLGPVHVVVDDLDVAVVGPGAAVGDVLVDRVAVRAGHDVEAAVLERGLGDRQRHADDRPGRLEREVAAVLVPRLAPGPGVLEDELRQEAVDGRPDQVGEQVGEGGRGGELGEDVVAVEREDLGGQLLGAAGAAGEVGLRQDEADAAPGHGRAVGPGPGDLDDPVEHAPAQVGVGEAVQPDVAVLVVVGLLVRGEAVGRRHRSPIR